VSSDPFKSRSSVRQALPREQIDRRHRVVGNARPKTVVSHSVLHKGARRRVAVALASVRHKGAPPASVLAAAVASVSVLQAAAGVSVLAVAGVNARSVVVDSVAGSVVGNEEDLAGSVVDRCAAPHVMDRQ